MEMNREQYIRTLQRYDDYCQRYLCKEKCDVYAHFRKSMKTPDQLVEFYSPIQIGNTNNTKEYDDPLGCSTEGPTSDNSETYAYTDNDVREIMRAYGEEDTSPLDENIDYSMETEEVYSVGDDDDTKEDDEGDGSGQDEEERDDESGQDVESDAEEHCPDTEQRADLFEDKA